MSITLCGGEIFRGCVLLRVRRVSFSRRWRWWGRWKARFQFAAEFVERRCGLAALLQVHCADEDLRIGGFGVLSRFVLAPQLPVEPARTATSFGIAVRRKGVGQAIYACEG